jgi:hypothetical protein
MGLTTGLRARMPGMPGTIIGHIQQIR